MTGAAPSRHAEFKRLLHAAARELGLPRSHDKPRRLAVVRLQRTALREVQERDLLAGRLSDPSRLLAADEMLRAEEERLAPSTGDPAVTVNILPMTLCAKCKAEVHGAPKPPTAALSEPASETPDTEKRASDVPTVTATASKPAPSNVVKLFEPGPPSSGL